MWKTMFWMKICRYDVKKKKKKEFWWPSENLDFDMKIYEFWWAKYNFFFFIKK